MTFKLPLEKILKSCNFQFVFLTKKFKKKN
jgi:hypothetical protein